MLERSNLILPANNGASSLYPIDSSHFSTTVAVQSFPKKKQKKHHVQKRDLKGNTRSEMASLYSIVVDCKIETYRFQDEDEIFQYESIAHI